MIDQGLIVDLFTRAGETAASLLSQALGLSVQVSAPTVSIANKNDIALPGGDPCMLSCAPVDSRTTGVVINALHPPLDTLLPELIVNPNATARPQHFTELHRGAAAELMSRYWAAAAPIFASFTGAPFRPAEPEIVHMPLSECLTALPMFAGMDSFVYVTQQIRIPDMASGRLSTILPASFLKEMIGAIEEKKAYAVSAAQPPAAPVGLGEIPLEHLHAEDGLRVAKGQHVSGAKAAGAKTRDSLCRNVEALLNVPMEIVAEIGAAVLEVDEILAITPGRVIELDHEAASPIGLYVNGKKIAVGKIVAVGDNFGVQVERVLAPDERLKVE